MKKKSLRRILLGYLFFLLCGVILTVKLASAGGYPLLEMSATKGELAAYLTTPFCLTWIAISIAAFIPVLVYILSVWLPLRHIAKAASRYAAGDFETPIRMQRADEIGFIADVMDYMAQELNSLEDDQRRFISNVSHDFRSPLTSIKGYAQAMADGTIPPELQEKYLKIIIFEAERLENLTQSLLDLNKYSTKGAYMDLSVFDINELIRRTALSFEGRCEEKNLTFDLALTGTTLYVKADAAKIDQVLHNLIDNAIKFSESHSSIRLETTIRNGKAFISVKDFGIGIPKESLNKIWERFYKTDLSRGKDKKGSGLGLAIVKEIIQLHHENINVISTQGVGTEFIFTLPLHRASDSTAEISQNELITNTNVDSEV